MCVCMCGVYVCVCGVWSVCGDYVCVWCVYVCVVFMCVCVVCVWCVCGVCVVCVWCVCVRLWCTVRNEIILITITLASSNNTLPDDGDCTETCSSCFNVNFNIPLKQLYCASVGK
jgi:Na+/H+-dicarboxylate symporter